MTIEVFGNTWTLTCKIHIKITFRMKTWNDPMTNTNILPQRILDTTTRKVQFLTKVLKSIFSKVWDSILKQYPTIWTDFCGKFDDSWMQNWSLESQDPFGRWGMEEKLNCERGWGYPRIPPVPVMLTQYRKKKRYSQEGWWVQWRVAGLIQKRHRKHTNKQTRDPLGAESW